MEKVEFSERLRVALKIRHMKAVDITEHTGISSSLLSQYMNNKKEPRADKLKLISDALDVNPVWLMGYDAPMVSDESDKKLENAKEIIFGTTDVSEDIWKEFIMMVAYLKNKGGMDK